MASHYLLVKDIAFVSSSPSSEAQRGFTVHGTTTIESVAQAWESGHTDNGVLELDADTAVSLTPLVKRSRT